MAGGMNKRGSWGPMRERTGAAPVADAAPEPPAIRHCWVTDRHGRQAGLLLEWEQKADGWHGRVVRPVLDDGVWVVVEEWLPRALLDPA